MYPWLQNKVVPSEQLKPVTQQNSHGSRSFLSVLGMAKRRGRGEGLSATFRDRGQWEEAGGMGTSPQLRHRQTQGSNSLTWHTGAAAHPAECLEDECDRDAA